MEVQLLLGKDKLGATDLQLLQRLTHLVAEEGRLELAALVLVPHRALAGLALLPVLLALR